MGASKEQPLLDAHVDDLKVERTAAAETHLGLPAPPSPLVTPPYSTRKRYGKKWSMALRTHVAVACCIMFAEGFFVTHLFPYVSFMTEELRHSDKSLGTATGIMYTAQSFGMMCSAYCWAWASNQYGRRPCLLVGLSCNIVVCALMIWCKSYWLMVMLRFLIGFLNNNLSIVRTTLREKFQLENEDDTAAFSMLSVAFGASSVAGPSCGGILYGVVLPGALRVLNPWSVPMLTCTALYVAAWMATALRLPETAPLGPRHTAVPAGNGDNGQGGKLLRESKFLLLLAIAGVHSYVFTGWELVYPLFARLRVEQGGQAWTTAQIGLTFLVGSCGLVFYSLTIFNRIAGKVPHIWLFIAGWIPVLVLVPIFPRVVLDLCDAGFPHHGPALQTLNYFVQLLVSVLLGSQFITVQLLLNDYVGDSGRLALANGYLVSCQALVRAAAPMITGTLFTLGEHPRRILGVELVSLALPFDHLALLGWIFGVLCAVVYSRAKS